MEGQQEDNVPTLSQKCPPEIEIELEKDTDKDTDTEREIKPSLSNFKI